MNRMPIVEAIWRDARYAVRVLARTPAFTVTAVATLALVIGATTAVFSLADALLWRPLPFPDADRLGMITYAQTQNGITTVRPATDGAMWEAVRDRVPALDAAVVGSGGGVNLVVNGAPVYALHSRVSEGFSRVLGIAPERGRWFSADEDRPGGPAVAVLSHRVWQQSFGGAEDIVGRSVLLRGEPQRSSASCRPDSGIAGIEMDL